MKIKFLTLEVLIVVIFIGFSLTRISGLVISLQKDDLDKSASEYLREANELFEQRKFNEAAVEYWNCLRKDSNIAEAHIKLAYIYHYSYSWNEDAYAKLHEAEKIEPNNPKIHLLLGKLQSLDGNSTEALKSYQKAIDLDPKNPEAYYYIGTVYQSEKMNEDAETSFKRAIENDTSHRTPLFEIAPFGLQSQLQLARLYNQSNRLDEAIKELEEAIAIEKDFGDAKNELIERLYDKANLVVRGSPATRPYFLAIDIYKKIVSVDPNQVEAWMELGRIYDSYLGDPKNALEAFEKAYDLEPQNLEALAIIEDLKQRLKL